MTIRLTLEPLLVVILVLVTRIYRGTVRGLIPVTSTGMKVDGFDGWYKRSYELSFCNEVDSHEKPIDDRVGIDVMRMDIETEPGIGTRSSANLHIEFSSTALQVVAAAPFAHLRDKITRVHSVRHVSRSK